jgi:transketolase
MSAIIPAYDILLRDIGLAHPDVVVIDAGLATSMRTSLFQQTFPERYFNLGIAEQNAIGVASGLARRGLIPIVHTFSNFLARRSHDQIALSVVWANCNVKLVGGSCGVYDGRNGPSHMATDDLVTMASLPGLMVLEPADQRQTRDLLAKAVGHAGPVYLRLRRSGAPNDLLSGSTTETGALLVRQDIAACCTLVACGSMLREVLLAHTILDDRGIHADLLHVSTLRPFDSTALLSSAIRTGHVISIENHILTGGFGDAIAQALGPLGIRHFRFALPAAFLPAGGAAWLLRYCRLDADSIAVRTAETLEHVHV